jgi:hypothetical protein
MNGQCFFGMYKTHWYCRWCGKKTAAQRSERDGFCPGGKCKQAWWRAFKKYINRVTKSRDRQVAAVAKSNAKRPRMRGMIKQKKVS